jgi:serine/threonine-protein kinase
VVEALRESTGERAALKVLAGPRAADKSLVALLQHEFEVGETLAHPRVIRFFQFEQGANFAYLAMELFSAPNLKKHLQAGGAESLAPWAGQIIEQSAEALAHLHDRGWVHRDVKADNFLINGAGDVKLIDLALAQKKKGFFGRLWGGKDRIQGTRSYMSPEQIRGESLDPRADIYSYGCMLFELLGGKPPFSGATTSELLNKHLKAAPPAIEAANRNVSAAFSRLLKRLLAKEPGDRPASLHEFLDEFKKLKLWETPPQRAIVRAAPPR